MYDVAIIGAGPAGSMLARLLPPRYRTLLVDRRRLDRPFEAGGLAKPCGGLLAPAAQRELARLGLGVPDGVVVGPQLFAVRTLDVAADLTQLYQRFYVNIDREAFDRWLVSGVPGGVERVFGWSMHALEREGDDGCMLRFRTAENGRAAVRARVVIGADGAASHVRRLAFPGAPGPQHYVAVQATFERSAAEPYYGAIFDERLTDYYGWTIPKADGLLVGLAVPSAAGAGAAFDRFVAGLRDHGLVDGRELSRAAAGMTRPRSPRQLLPGSGGVLLAGEAAGFVSPSSGEGISYALASARALAAALAPGISGASERYRVAIAPTAARTILKAVKGSAIYGPATRRAIMRAGVGAMVPSHPPAPRGVTATG